MNAELMPSEPATGTFQGQPALPEGWWEPALGDLGIGEGTFGFGIAAHAYPAIAASVGAARRFASRCLAEWGMSRVTDDLCLVVSELVGNGCRHAVRGRDPERTRLLVQLRPLPSIGSVVCMVHDPDPRGPVRVAAHQFAESGRGLGLINAFSREWGWEPLLGSGKVVWAACATGTA